MMFLQNWGPLSGTTGIIAAVAFFIFFVIMAVIVYKVLRRTVKMAFRLVMVAVILTVAVAGSIALWALGSGGDPARPAANRPR